MSQKPLTENYTQLEQNYKKKIINLISIYLQQKIIPKALLLDKPIQEIMGEQKNRKKKKYWFLTKLGR